MKWDIQLTQQAINIKSFFEIKSNFKLIWQIQFQHICLIIMLQQQCIAKIAEVGTLVFDNPNQIDDI